MRLLDTNVCVELLRGRDADLLDQYAAHSDLHLCDIVVAELLYGAEKSDRPQTKPDTLAFVARHDLLIFGHEGAESYAHIRLTLERAGQKISGNDLFIAATALAHGATLVTRNTGEFSRVTGLALEDWR